MTGCNCNCGHSGKCFPQDDYVCETAIDRSVSSGSKTQQSSVLFMHLEEVDNLLRRILNQTDDIEDVTAKLNGELLGVSRDGDCCDTEECGNSLMFSINAIKQKAFRVNASLSDSLKTLHTYL